MPEQTLQLVLCVETERPTLRADIIGWSAEDPRKVVEGPIGWTRRGELPEYDCVLRALADGWRLLGPPTPQAYIGSTCDWWLVKDVPATKGAGEGGS